MWRWLLCSSINPRKLINTIPRVFHQKKCVAAFFFCFNNCINCWNIAVYPTKPTCLLLLPSFVQSFYFYCLSVWNLALQTVVLFLLLMCNHTCFRLSAYLFTEGKFLPGATTYKKDTGNLSLKHGMLPSHSKQGFQAPLLKDNHLTMDNTPNFCLDCYLWLFF